jgi:hypothetical protein
MDCFGPRLHSSSRPRPSRGKILLVLLEQDKRTTTNKTSKQEQNTNAKKFITFAPGHDEIVLSRAKKISSLKITAVFRIRDIFGTDPDPRIRSSD